VSVEWTRHGLGFAAGSILEAGNDNQYYGGYAPGHSLTVAAADLTSFVKPHVESLLWVAVVAMGPLLGYHLLALQHQW
jgi:hypothetical protein